MLKLVDLAKHADFSLGDIRVSPSRRVIEGPSGRAHVQPIVMKLFLVLVQADGAVVTRDELFSKAWGGVFVGDDSLNQAIARIRKVAAETAPGLFDIETVPRTGYRMVGPAIEKGKLKNGGAGLPHSRRLFIGAAAASAALCVTGAAVWTVQRRSDSRFDRLIDDAERQLSVASELNPPATIATLQQAVALDPGNARAWGLLALTQSMVALSGTPMAATAIAGAEQAARRAVAIDPREPNAQLALYELQGITLDWFARDRRLRDIIALDPGNIFAISELVALLQSAGLTHESWDWNERAIGIDPAVPDLLCRRAMKLWIEGRFSAADNVIDHARDLWPSNPFVSWVRFLLLATTGRAAAAAALLKANPQILPPPAVPLWRTALRALAQPSASSIAAAKQACTGAAQSSAMLAAQSAMIAGALGDVDLAFEISESLLLWRGRIVHASGNRASRIGSDALWRSGVQWLFTPPLQGMRADKRFLPLCDDVGLAAYWRRRGVKPDYLRGATSLTPEQSTT